MSAPAGATPADWAHWSLTLECTEDLLPCVVEPGCVISPGSALVGYGKVPSLFNSAGQVVGWPKWTQYVATHEDVGKWEKDSRLGICLQTRRLRALDVDVTDQGLADQISLWLEEHLGECPVRWRGDSAKFLVLVELTDDKYPKQTLQTPGGVIEFLADGQQCLVAGRHKDGARYEWSNGGCQIPTIDGLDLELLQHGLLQFASPGAKWTGGRLGRARVVDALGSVPADDEVSEYLEAQGLVVGRAPGRVDVTCPWSGDHTAGEDPSASSWFLAGTGGYERGAYRCLHSHCSGRAREAFLAAVGFTEYDALDGFEDLGPSEVLTALIGPDGVASGTVSPIKEPKYVINEKSKQRKPIINNFLKWLRYQVVEGGGVRYDVFTDQIEIDTPHGRRPFTDTDYTSLQARAEAEKFEPIGRQLFRDAIRLAAFEICYDSGKDWLTTLPLWDGIPRVDTFCSHYLGAEQNAHSRAVGRYLWSAMPGRIHQPGIQADMTLILVSTQGTRKSSTIRAMAPTPAHFTEVSFSDDEDALARLTKGKTLVEIPELKGLRSRDIEWIKAFVTKRENSWVPKYLEMRTTYLRRFLMVGTTNEDEFLADPTGERRWLPLRVGRQDDDAIIRDHDQLWAEGYALFLAHGIQWAEAQESAKLIHHEFTVHDAIIDRMRDWLNESTFGEKKNAECEFLRVLDVWRGVYPNGNPLPNKAEQMRVADALSRCGYKRVTKRTLEGVSKVWVKEDRKVVTEVVTP